MEERNRIEVPYVAVKRVAPQLHTVKVQVSDLSKELFCA
jgi:hypothetical protein